MTGHEETSKASVDALPARTKTSFGGDVLRLASGTTFAQFLSILAAPVLTRIYAPEAYGVLALFTSITSILGVIACMRYELAVMLPESDAEAANLLGVSLMSATLLSLLSTLIVLWGQSLLSDLLNAPQLVQYLWMVPPVVLLGGAFSALNYWNSRTRRFGRLSMARVSQSVATVSTQLILGFTGYVTGGALIGASVGGQALATTVLGGQIWRDNSGLFRRSIRWPNMLAGIRKYQKFPKYSVWTALLNTVSWQIPVFMLATFFSTSVVGYYALGFRLIQLPMSFIGAAIGQVFYQRAAKAKEQGTLSALVEELFGKLVLIGFLPTMMMALIGADAFEVLLGAEWREAGVYAQILSTWAFFWFISSPLSLLTTVLGLLEVELRFTSILLVSRIVSLGIGGIFAEPRLALSLFSLSGVAYYAYLSYYLMRSAQVSSNRQIRILRQSGMVFLPFGVAQATLMAFVSQVEIRLFSSGALSLLCLLVLLKFGFVGRVWRREQISLSSVID